MAIFLNQIELIVDSMKLCNKCNISLDFKNFWLNSKSKDGYCAYCIPCFKMKKKVSDKKYKQSLKGKDNNKRYSQSIKGKIARKKAVNKYQTSSLGRYKKNEARKKRESSKITLKLAQLLRNRTKVAIKIKNLRKSKHFHEYIGCTSIELKQHLEKQFQPGMTWENHSFSGWHIDHIIPLCSAKNEQELYKLCHFTNLQPLWAQANLQKGGR